MKRCYILSIHFNNASAFGCSSMLKLLVCLLCSLSLYVGMLYDHLYGDTHAHAPYTPSRPVVALAHNAHCIVRLYCWPFSCHSFGFLLSQLVLWPCFRTSNKRAFERLHNAYMFMHICDEMEAFWGQTEEEHKSSRMVRRMARRPAGRTHSGNVLLAVIAMHSRSCRLADSRTATTPTE